MCRDRIGRAATRVRRRWRVRALCLATALAIAIGIPAAIAVFRDTATAGSPFSSNPDWYPPLVTGGVLYRGSGCLTGEVRTGDTYRIYANASDIHPHGYGVPSGIASETADASTITSIATAEALTSSSDTVDGATYGYRSGVLTVDGSEGSKQFTITSTDAAGNVRPSGSYTQSAFGAAIDNTLPVAADVQITNKVGGTPGRAEQGDVITLTFNDEIDPCSILSASTAWTSNSVEVRLYDACDPLLGLLCGSAADRVRIYGLGGSQILGEIVLPGDGYNYRCAVQLLGACATIESEPPVIFTPSPIVRSTSPPWTYTITLGPETQDEGEVGESGMSTWNPTSAPYDGAGNALSSAARNESGANDREF